MIPIFRVPVAPRRKEEKETSPMENTYSYHEVENILCRAIRSLNSASLIRDNDIEILCAPDCMEWGVRIQIRQGDKLMVMRAPLERDEK